MSIYKNIQNKHLIRGSEEGGFKSRAIAQAEEPFFLICPECHAIREHKRWFYDRETPESARSEHHEKICPGCEAVKNKWYEGMIIVKNEAIDHLSGQIQSQIHNLEEEHRQSDPRNRIIDIEKKAGEWRIYTATPYLARQIASSLESAYHLKAHYKWSPGNKLVKIMVV